MYSTEMKYIILLLVLDLVVLFIVLSLIPLFIGHRQASLAYELKILQVTQDRSRSFEITYIVGHV